jgi:hypothetical protein
MTGFEAVVADIETSAAGMASAGETVGAADPGADLTGVGTALEGGTSPAAATSLSAAWSKRFSAWSTSAKQHATARRNSAAGYTRADHDAAIRMELEAIASRGPAVQADR